MEIEIKPVTDEVRFATVLSAITDSRDSTISDESALFMDDSVTTGHVASNAKRTMPIRHLWWIVPITLVIGAWIGAALYADKQKKKSSVQELS